MRIGVIGDRGTGCSTWIGLLLQSMEKFTNEHPEMFNYFMDRDTTEMVINNIRNPLLGGVPPRKTDNLEISTSFKGNKTKGFLRRGKKKVTLQITDTLANKGSTDQIATNDIISQDIIVLLLDCSRLGNKVYKKKNLDLINVYKRCWTRYPDKCPVPIIFFTKIDRLPMPIIRKLPNHSEDLLYDYLEYDEETINEDGKFILQKCYSSLYITLYDKKGKNFPEPKIFFSWMGIRDDRYEVLRYNTKQGDEIVSNRYPYNHYYEFIRLIDIII